MGGTDKKLHKTVLASQMGSGIMPNTVRKSQGILFLKLSGNLV